ncbi:MAG: PH domain-containing protein [Candidatus Uhrbacteria bacterium]|nr:PH domain-containing protein [Candidatus Uhrbacteria bacterium]
MIHLTQLPNAEADEQLIFFLRRHWFVLIPLILGTIVVLALPFVGYAFLAFRMPALLENKAQFAAIVMGGSTFFLFTWLFVFQNFIDWYLDVWIVTNQRIINIEQNGLFGRTMSELRLYNVQDVTSTTNGFLQSMFNYGNVTIQTSAEKKQFEFEEIEHPDHVAKRILELAHESNVAQEHPPAPKDAKKSS